MTLLPVFDKYFNREDAQFFYTLFQANGLQPVLEEPKGSFDAILGNYQGSDQYILRLPAGDFAQAKNIIEHEIRQNDIPADYYLRTFTTEELKNILKNDDEWSRQDTATAKILLEEQSAHIDNNEIAEAKKEKKKLEKSKRKIDVPILILLYLIAPLGAIIPIAAGLIIYNFKDYDSDGIKDYVYTDEYRKHGLALCIIGIFSVAVFTYLIIAR